MASADVPGMDALALDEAPGEFDGTEDQEAAIAAQLVWGDAQEGQPPVDHEQLASAPVATQPTM